MSKTIEENKLTVIINNANNLIMILIKAKNKIKT